LPAACSTADSSGTIHRGIRREGFLSKESDKPPRQRKKFAPKAYRVKCVILGSAGGEIERQSRSPKAIFHQIPYAHPSGYPEEENMNTILWVLQIILCIKFLSVAYSHGLQQNNSNMRQSIIKIGKNGLILHKLFSVIIFIVSIMIILPGVLGMNNWITVYVALILAILILLSIGIHVLSREKPLIFADIILLAIAAFVVYGRWMLIPS
jgi:hypothetical protein